MNKPRVILFLGAGFSNGMDSALPTGRELLDRIARKLNIDKPVGWDTALNFIQSIFPHVASYQFGFEYILGLISQLRADNDRAEVSAVLGDVDPEQIWNTLLSTLASVVRYIDRAYEDAGRPAGPPGFQNYRNHPVMGPFIEILEYLHNNCSNVSIVTTNYDLICDKAVCFIHDALNGHTDIRTAVTDMRRYQYGVPVRALWRITSGTNSKFCDKLHDWEGYNQFHILKLHGSLNWAYCEKCKAVDIAETKDDLPYIQNRELRTKCPACGTKYAWIIIPPLPHKPIEDDPVISKVWIKAREIVEKADRIIFVGYSMPEVDPLVVQMLLRARIKASRTRGRCWDYIIFDKDEWVHNRYKNLFGKPFISISSDGFDINRFKKDWLEKIVDIHMPS